MSADGLRVGLERQIAKWRQTAIEERARAEALRSPKIDFQYPQGALVLSRAYCLEQLASELAALLHAHPPAAPPCPLCPVELSEVPQICERCAKQLASALLPPEDGENRHPSGGETC